MECSGRCVSFFYKHHWSGGDVLWSSGIDVSRVFGQEQRFRPRGSLWVSWMVGYEGYEGCALARGFLVLTGLGIPQGSHHNNIKTMQMEQVK